MSCLSDALGGNKCDYCQFNDICKIKSMPLEIETSDCNCRGCDGNGSKNYNELELLEFYDHLRWYTKS